MIFVGDIALPIRDTIQIKSIPSELFQKNWFGNLEGGIVDNSDEICKRFNKRIQFQRFCIG